MRLFLVIVAHVSVLLALIGLGVLIAGALLKGLQPPDLD